ncbi:MAG: nuclear transport factor 2 family protein [Capsulimonadales bacterium]|nr:nuclear transport factor 2 family protein [Capsulimonadales bacterium]
MKTENLRINQLSPDGYAWYISYLTALDAKDITAYGAFLADDCVMWQNNQPPVQGKTAILEGLAGYWATFGTLEHDLTNLYGTDDHFVLEALNHYSRSDGQPVTLRAVAFTDRNEQGLVSSFRFYTDVTPLFG